MKYIALFIFIYSIYWLGYFRGRRAESEVDNGNDDC